ncbi:MAG: MaoC family dehydratase [Alphaproteobacteria bacterium]
MADIEAKIAELSDKIGTETGVSDWHQITQDQINLFADATGDHQFIHVDVEAATKLFGSTIAHGFLTLSLLPILSRMPPMEGVTRGINYGCNKVRFTNMVPVDSKVRARTVLKELAAKGGGMQVTSEVTMEIEGQDRPAMVAETLTIIYFD